MIENFRLLISFVLTALLLGSQPSFFILGTSLSFFRVHVLIDFLPLSTMLIVFGIAGLAMVQADALTCWSPFQAINSTEPHDTGQFLEMLVASTERPAMLAFKELVARSERYRAHDRCMFFFSFVVCSYFGRQAHSNLNGPHPNLSASLSGNFPMTKDGLAEHAL